MFSLALADLIRDLAWLMNELLGALILVIIVRVILSWVNADPYNGLVRAIYAIAEPLLKPFRRLVPPWKLGGIDISPILAILAVEFIRRFLVTLLYQLADNLH